MTLSHITIQITTCCPLGCGQCYMQRGARVMPPATFKDVVMQAKSLGARVVQLTGGEPLSHPDIFSLVRFCADEGLSPVLSTSGCGADFKTLFLLKQSGLSVLCVSLNGSTVEVNSKSRQGFLQAVGAIETAAAVSLDVVINFVARADNYFDLTGLIEYARGKGAKGVWILKNHPAFGGTKESELNGEQLEALAKAVRGSGGFAGVENCFFELKRILYPREATTCDAQTRSRFVNVDGSFCACSKLTEICAPTPSDDRLKTVFCGG